jgi:hypothetical protein
MNACVYVQQINRLYYIPLTPFPVFPFLKQRYLLPPLSLFQMIITSEGSSMHTFMKIA